MGPYLGHREALLHQLPAALRDICSKERHEAQALDAFCRPDVGHMMTVMRLSVFFRRRVQSQHYRLSG